MEHDRKLVNRLVEHDQKNCVEPGPKTDLVRTDYMFVFFVFFVCNPCPWLYLYRSIHMCVHIKVR